MYKLIKNFFAVLFLVQVLLVSGPVLAQGGLGESARQAGLPGAPKTGEGKSTISLPQVTGTIINGALSLIGIAFFGLMLWGGFIWMKARGNEQEVERAKNMVTNAILGIIVIAAAYTITSFVLTNLAPGT
jgi:hypothetical protein